MLLIFNLREAVLCLFKIWQGIFFVPRSKILLTQDIIPRAQLSRILGLCLLSDFPRPFQNSQSLFNFIIVDFQTCQFVIELTNLGVLLAEPIVDNLNSLVNILLKGLRLCIRLLIWHQAITQIIQCNFDCGSWRRFLVDQSVYLVRTCNLKLTWWLWGYELTAVGENIFFLVVNIVGLRDGIVSKLQGFNHSNELFFIFFRILASLNQLVLEAIVGFNLRM